MVRPAFIQDRPETVGLSAPVLTRIRRDSENDIAAGKHVGTVSLIARRGLICHFEAVGLRDREAGTPMRKDVIFRVYSNTKLMTSVAMMTLFDEGKFQLDDPVSKFLPDLGSMRVGVEEGEGDSRTLKLVPAEREITVRHLLTHTGGLSYGWDQSSLVDRMYGEAGVYYGARTIAETVEKLGKLPLKYQPGTTWEYSLSCDVLGRLAEVISGKPYDRFLKERVLDPLGMADTGFFVPPEKAGRLAGNYRLGADGKAERVPPPDMSSPWPNVAWNFLKPTPYFSGGGGLVSTAADHLSFCQMLLNRGNLGESVVLKPETVDLMLTNQLPANVAHAPFSQGMGMGLGFSVGNPKDGKPGWHCGWGGMAGTSVWIDTVLELAAVFMIQIHNHEAATRFEDAIYESVIGR